MDQDQVVPNYFDLGHNYDWHTREPNVPNHGSKSISLGKAFIGTDCCL